MFDDRLWNHVWERNLNPVERHSIAVAVWRRRRPDDRFEAMVACELARRWRRHILVLVTGYALWTLFWGSIALHDLRLNDGFSSLLTPTCAAIGVAAIVACLAVRRWLAGYLAAHSIGT